MTSRQLDILTAWWVAKGSCKKASALLGIGHQPVKNALYHMRLEEQADTSLDLALRHMDEIDRRQKKLLRGQR